MSEVNANDLTKITKADDVFDLYAGAGKQAKSGIEVELAFINPGNKDLSAMSLCQNRVLKNSAAAALPNDDWVHNEPTSELLEIASKAYDFSDAKNLLAETNNKIRILSEKALGLGLKRSYFQELPERSANNLLSRIVDVERYKVMYAPYRDDMKKCVQYFAVCKSNQVSVSPYNMNHMLENVRRLYILAPFLFMITDNSAGFSEGKPFAGHAGMALRHNGLTEGRGGVLPYVFSARSGEEYIANHIDHVMNNPLFMYYDQEGELNKVPSGNWGVTFNSLKERGLNIASNYYLAQSVIWPDVKIATLKDDEGAVFGHRFEARMFGVGVHQHQTAYLITSGLAFNATFAAGVDELLERYGFNDDNLQEPHALVLASYKAARNHNGKFLDIAYGNGRMAGFAKDFAVLAEDLAVEIGMEDEMQPLSTICSTGCTDGRVNRKLFPTLKSVIEQQRHYDPAVFYEPNKSALEIFGKGILDKCDSLCAVV